MKGAMGASEGEKEKNQDTLLVEAERELRYIQYIQAVCMFEDGHQNLEVFLTFISQYYIITL